MSEKSESLGGKCAESPMLSSKSDTSLDELRKIFRAEFSPASVSTIFRLFANWSTANLNPRQRERDWRRLKRIDDAVMKSISDQGGPQVIDLNKRVEELEDKLSISQDGFDKENAECARLEADVSRLISRNHDLIEQIDSVKLKQMSEGW